MRSFYLGSLAVGVFGAFLATGCGDSGTGTTGTGGSGTGGSTTNTGGSTTNGTGGAPGCVAVDVPTFEYIGSDLSGYLYYGGGTSPALGGADDDQLNLILEPDATGTIDLTGQGDLTTCTTCVIVAEDLDVDGNATKLYAAQSGTVTLGTTTPYYIAGTITNASLVEVDPTDGTIVPNGACITVASISFDIQPPVAGWSCDPSYYEDMLGCDCDCGAVDPDCSDATMDLYGCQTGQTCNAGGTCEGVPTAWTCPADQFNGGAGNGCDCNCGAWDPDCDLMPAETVDGCATGETCAGSVASEKGVCLPTAWTCNPAFYLDGTDCDCGCGVLDPDCTDATKASCDYCDDNGSCDAVACDDAASTIDATNNAVCN